MTSDERNKKIKNCLGEIQAIKETLKALEDNITKLLSEHNQECDFEQNNFESHVRGNENSRPVLRGESVSYRGSIFADRNLVNQSRFSMYNSEFPQLKKSQKQVALFIDGENFSHKKTEKLLSAAKKFGILCSATIYDRPSNKDHWKKWSKIASQYGLTLRQVQSKKKNAVDNIIINDIYNTIGHRDDIDVFCLASADGGYAPALMKAKNNGKKVVVMHTSSVSEKLQTASDKVVIIK